MLYGEGLAAVAELCLLVYCLLDVLTTPSPQVRTLPKLGWLLVCFVPPVLGPICWLLFGRPQRGTGLDLPDKGNRGPRRPAPSRPDDDEDFLRGLRERAEEQRRRGREDDA